MLDFIQFLNPDECLFSNARKTTTGRFSGNLILENSTKKQAASKILFYVRYD